MKRGPLNSLVNLALSVGQFAFLGWLSLHSFDGAKGVLVFGIGNVLVLTVVWKAISDDRRDRAQQPTPIVRGET